MVYLAESKQTDRGCIKQPIRANGPSSHPAFRTLLFKSKNKHNEWKAKVKEFLQRLSASVNTESIVATMLDKPPLMRPYNMWLNEEGPRVLFILRATRRTTRKKIAT
ncbi:unnamed protein product [Dovyalis caffra]|uniref:Uncharacterized protein n=1 Tax=Dovyalis caffra TaxID=77055 RepID=A0AAV1SIB7_9ROSI|nr:unnamed protein product [Dovyalis caffra]